MPTTVYCDESGFTGEFLLDRRQRFFSYASVAIEPEEAAEIVARIVRDHRVQGNELKGRRLIAYAPGRRAVLRIIDDIGARAQIVVHHKEFALAAKFFEYVFEPLVSDVNSIFYTIDFHLFIGNLIYMHAFLRKDRALELTSRFQDAIHRDDLAFRQITAIHAPGADDPIEQIISFCVYNRDAILKELEEIRGFGGWTAELTSTSLYSLLTTWGERHESLRVFCDQSIPLIDQMDFFNVMVGRTDKRRVRMGRRESSIIFNLAEPLQLVNSRDTPGVQLADVLAAAVCFSMETPNDDWCHTVFQKCLELGTINDHCIHPDLEHVDLRKKPAVINCMVLLELLERSRRGASLTEGIKDFILRSLESYPEYERRQRFDLDVTT